MKFLFGSAFLALILLNLTSCSPVYKIAHDFQPPSSPHGLACVRSCQSQLNQCNRQCSNQFKQCSIKAEQQAKKLLPGLLQAYPKHLLLWQNARNTYQHDLDWYEFRLDMAEVRRENRIDNCIRGGKSKSNCHSAYGGYLHAGLPYSRPTFNIPRPEKPSLAKEAAKLRKLNCSNDCGCNSNYRLCYASCGGIVKSKKVCIKNCK